MISNADIEDAVSRLLKEETGLDCHSDEVLEGFTLPCFFLKVKLTASQSAGIATVRKSCRCIINFLGEINENMIVRSEEQKRDMAATLYKLFFRTLKVKDRHLLLTDQSDELGGENQDILIFTFNTEYFDGIEEEEKDVIEDVSINKSVKG